MKRPALLCLYFAAACGGSSDKSESESDQTESEQAPDGTTEDGTGSDAGPSAGDLEPGVNELTIEQVVEGETVERTYLLHLPADYDASASEATPLLFAFHGSGGAGTDFINQFVPSIEEHDFIGVYPDGIASSWNIEREESNADDVAFAASILDALDGVAGIDTERPVGIGFSNGAALVHKIAMESDLFVAIVPQASQLLVDSQPTASAAKVSVMQFHGTADPVCPYDGGTGILDYNFMPAEDSTAAWAAHNGCDATATETDIAPHVRMEWLNCENDRRVIHYRMNGAGHEVPPDVDGGSNARIIEFLIEARQ
ncbi:MAG TPA: hypothetical protein DFR83_24790 [Deltaproteobacteria bacterium]|nr:hypothetical protein [Deltaproteobacteria bacterium]